MPWLLADHRPDYEQMVIALIVSSEGFPFSYETFDGNRADATTMETRVVERKYGKARLIRVFDRGVVSKDNLQAIRSRSSSRMEGALQRLAKSIETGRLKDRNKMERRRGAIQAGHPQVNDLREVALRDTPHGIRLFWQIKE